MKKKEIKKQCELCGEQYTITSNNQKRCSICKDRYNRIYHHEYNITHREHHAEYMREYYSNEENHSKHLARVTANNNKYAGRVSMASRCCIKGCKCKTDLQLHHIEYGDGLINLATVTVCRKHHKKLHQEMRQHKEKKYIRQSISANVSVGVN